MKAQRRHELKQNSLFSILQHIPDLGKQLGTRLILLSVLLLLLIVWAVVRYQNAAQREADARKDLTDALEYLRELNLTRQVVPGQEALTAQTRRALFTAAVTAADDAIDKAGDQHPGMIAQALILRGDVNFALADLPEIYGAATQPSLRLPRSPVELLRDAADSYQSVLDHYPNQTTQVVAGHFGISAVFEEMAPQLPDKAAILWEGAKENYQAIINAPNVSQAYRQLAQQRLEALLEIQRPIFGMNTTRPSTRPAVRTPETGLSATAPSAPLAAPAPAAR